MRTDLLVNNLTLNAYQNNKLKIFEGHFRRNFIHIKDVVDSFVFGIENFNKIKNNIYNIGLSSANITKYQLAIKIKKFIPKLKIKNIFNVRDPDQRDYFVSNKKIEQKGFKAKISIEDGIKELLKFYKYSDFKIKNNY
jgi:nucleoside-diphosphate-sugar epimerase